MCKKNYIIPEIMFGVPLYDKNECIKFVFENLVTKGFKIICKKE